MSRPLARPNSPPGAKHRSSNLTSERIQPCSRRKALAAESGSSAAVQVMAQALDLAPVMVLAPAQAVVVPGSASSVLSAP